MREQEERAGGRGRNKMKRRELGDAEYETTVSHVSLALSLPLDVWIKQQL